MNEVLEPQTKIPSVEETKAEAEFRKEKEARESHLQQSIQAEIDYFNKLSRPMNRQEKEQLKFYFNNLGANKMSVDELKIYNTFFKAVKLFIFRSGILTDSEDFHLIGTPEFKEELRKIFHFED
jgi:hypothetical protein